MIFKKASQKTLRASNTIPLVVVKNSKSVEKLIHDFRSYKEQKILRNIIFDTLKIPNKEKNKILSLIENSGIEKSENFKNFSNIYNKEIWCFDLLPYMADFIELAPTAKGYGKGELFLAFLNKNIIINGGAGSFDVSLFGDEAEVKEVKVKHPKNAPAILHNFKFGTENRSKILKIVEIAKLYVKQYLLLYPDNYPEDAVEKLNKGELNRLLTITKLLEKSKGAKGLIHFSLDSDGNIYIGDNLIGNIKNNFNLHNYFLDLIQNTKPITWNDIINKTKELLGSSKRSYIFIAGQVTTTNPLGKICYKDSIGESIMPLDFTQNLMKIGVECEYFKK